MCDEYTCLKPHSNVECPEDSKHSTREQQCSSSSVTLPVTPSKQLVQSRYSDDSNESYDSYVQVKQRRMDISQLISSISIHMCV
jgi:hypothetical protein